MRSGWRFIFALILFILALCILAYLIFAIIGFKKVKDGTLSHNSASLLLGFGIAAAIATLIILIMSIVIFFYNPKAEVSSSEPIVNNPIDAATYSPTVSTQPKWKYYTDANGCCQAYMDCPPPKPKPCPGTCPFPGTQQAPNPYVAQQSVYSVPVMTQPVVQYQQPPIQTVQKTIYQAPPQPTYQPQPQVVYQPQPQVMYQPAPQNCCPQPKPQPCQGSCPWTPPVTAPAPVVKTTTTTTKTVPAAKPSNYQIEVTSGDEYGEDTTMNGEF